MNSQPTMDTLADNHSSLFIIIREGVVRASCLFSLWGVVTPENQQQNKSAEDDGVVVQKVVDLETDFWGKLLRYL